jgi:hypothetical protein
MPVMSEPGLFGFHRSPRIFWPEGLMRSFGMMLPANGIRVPMPATESNTEEYGS